MAQVVGMVQMIYGIAPSVLLVAFLGYIPSLLALAFIQKVVYIIMYTVIVVKLAMNKAKSPSYRSSNHLSLYSRFWLDAFHSAVVSFAE